MLFGAGALLIPAALLIFALTFFVGDEEPLSGRVALGLALVTIAILSITSITYPGADTDSGVVLAHDILRMRGGYLGGGIAWALLQTVGREVGIVLLVGVAIAGVVICGFSISEAVTNIRNGTSDVYAERVLEICGMHDLFNIQRNILVIQIAH
jgi:S-DNA-T family DNA segregation ATPase FtsK/SpoIIIE